MSYIRLAKIEDVASMSRIHALTWKEAYKGLIPQEYLNGISEDKWIKPFTDALSNKLHEAAIINNGETDTGCVCFGKSRDGEAGYGEIISIYVLPAYWSTRQGYELMNFALNRLKKQNFDYCHLWVLEGNTRALNFYERYGFRSDNKVRMLNIAGVNLRELRYSIKL
ncbi:GNAT family N-acetyltransferase [Caldicellulosiruptor acetigenus]|uniref:GNAT family N-acetyltransferase n=1 Tax=Caldicellulosiruptor acetigenus TaxID=301953 RepID=UPI000492303B|nr:GNAT family N-acetyltransferase [Caldicellulosiruptor acetigenus]WAM35848.1 GNAT family N-acetyltransferase [Caldicellulosiruptor acetigenus]